MLDIGRSSILVLYSDPRYVKKIASLLSGEDYEITYVGSLEDLIIELIDKTPEILVFEYMFYKNCNTDLLFKLKKAFNYNGLVIIPEEAQTLYEHRQRDVFEFVKENDLKEKLRSINNERQKSGLAVTSYYVYEHKELLGRSGFIQDLNKSIKARISQTDSPVLIYGERCNGAEIVAYCIHLNSSRHVRPFVVFDCLHEDKDTHQDSLFVREVSGAVREKGLISKTNGGTLLLTNVQELSHAAQISLLKYLQKGYFRIGKSRRRVDTNTRIIAAANDSIKMCLACETFKEELYHLLDMIEIRIPPLRERKEDIEAHISYFSKTYSNIYNVNEKHFSDEVLAAFKEYYYPGNLTELKNFMEQIYSKLEKDTVTLEDMPHPIISFMKGTIFSLNNFSVENVIDEHISRVLRMVNGNRKKASDILGISERALYYKIKNEK